LRSEEDLELVARILRGNDRSFQDLVERFNGVVYSAARSILGNRNDMEDTVQEIYIKIYRGLPSFKWRSKLSSWIYRIARNQALNARAGRRHDLQPIDENYKIASTANRPDEEFGRSRRREQLEILLRELDENYRAVIELRYMADKSYTEIAEIMDIPVGTVKTYLHRAKAAMRKKIRSSGLETGWKGSPD